MIKWFLGAIASAVGLILAGVMIGFFKKVLLVLIAVGVIYLIYRFAKSEKLFYFGKKD